jgi:ABC-type bacteriocin/lantibiotic exporter with double-glycine peptidase domain
LPHRETGLLVGAAVLIFLSYQGRTALTSLGSYLTLNAVQKMALRLRIDMLRHLDKLSADYYEKTTPGTVMYPLKEPIEEVAYFGSDPQHLYRSERLHTGCVRRVRLPVARTLRPTCDG